MAMIKVIAERCKSCGNCVKYCPKQMLAVGRHVNAKGYEVYRAGQPGRLHRLLYVRPDLPGRRHRGLQVKGEKRRWQEY